MTNRLALLPLALGVSLACGAMAAEQAPAQAPLVKAKAQTEATAGGGSDSATFAGGR